MRSFKLLVGDEKRTIEIDEEGRPSIDGRTLRIKSWMNEGGLLTAWVGRRSQRILVDRIGYLLYDVWINHRCYHVTIEDNRSRYLDVIKAPAASHEHRGEITAPMPGLIARIEVKIGSIVERGTGLLVLEAMKMENEITSPMAGTVKAIHIQPRAGVEKGALLVTIAPHSEKKD